MLNKLIAGMLLHMPKKLVWIFYRRFKENPKMASYIIKALFIRK